MENIGVKKQNPDRTTNLAEMLTKAETDDDKFAALLIVAEFAKKKNKFYANEQKKILESIDIRFITKLLSAKDEVEGCEDGMFVSLGLDILTCVIAGSEVVNKRDDILIIIPNLLDIICKRHWVFKKPVSQSLQEDIRKTSFALLCKLMENKKGCNNLIANSGIDWLQLDTVDDDENAEISMKILMNVLKNADSELLMKQDDKIYITLDFLCRNFSKFQDNNKFKLLDWITSVFMICRENSVLNNLTEGSIVDTSSNLLSNLRMGLSDILKSKVKKEIKQTCIKLISALFDIYGMEWAIRSDKSASLSNDFLLLIASVASIEINLCLHKLNNNVDDLCASLSIMEHLIHHLVNENHIDSSKEEKLFKVIFETVEAVLIYIKELKNVNEIKTTCKDVKTIACYRFLCSWMCEETMALNTDFLETAPFILKLAKENFKANPDAINFDKIDNDPALFNFILPVLCHWSADEKFRKIILNENIHFYLKLFLKESIEDGFLEGKPKTQLQFLETVLGIFLNLVITERDLASQPESIFFDVLQIIIGNIENYVGKCKTVAVTSNMVTLALILARLHHTGICKDKDKSVWFFTLCATYFYNYCPVKENDDKLAMLNSEIWNEIEELWLIGMDNFTACIPLFPNVQEALKCNDNFAKLATLRKNKVSNNTVDCDAMFSALDKLFC